MSAIGLVSWLWRPVWRLREIGWGDVALAAILSVWAIGLVSGVVVAKPHSGVAAAIVVLAMTIPVAWERRDPARGRGRGSRRRRPERAAYRARWCAAARACRRCS